MIFFADNFQALTNLYTKIWKVIHVIYNILYLISVIYPFLYVISVIYHCLYVTSTYISKLNKEQSASSFSLLLAFTTPLYKSSIQKHKKDVLMPTILFCGFSDWRHA